MRIRVASALAAAAALVIGGLVVAPAAQAAPDDLTVQLTSAKAGGLTGAVIAYSSTSGWAKTNVSVTFPGWTANGVFTSTGSAGCPQGITVTSSPRGSRPDQPASVSECSWSQDATGALLNLVVASNTGLDGPVRISLPAGALRNPTAPSVYAVRLAEQSSTGWAGVSTSVAVGTPSAFTSTFTNALVEAPAGVTLQYTSASGWAGTNVTFTLPGWTANSTFASTGSAPCPAAIQISAVPASATFSQCSWTQEATGATFSVVVNSPGIGLSGPVTVVLPKGAVTNPALAGTYQTRVVEQTSAGFVSLTDDVAVGVPSDLTVSLASRTTGAPSGAASIGFTTWSSWASTNLVVTFPGFTAQKTFASTGSRPCPKAVRIAANPSLVTTSQCSWSQEGADAVLTVTLDAPGYGLQGPVAINLGSGTLRNPGRAGLVNIRIAQQSSAGWTGASAPVIIR